MSFTQTEDNGNVEQAYESRGRVKLSLLNNCNGSFKRISTLLLLFFSVPVLFLERHMVKNHFFFFGHKRETVPPTPCSETISLGRTEIGGESRKHTDCVRTWQRQSRVSWQHVEEAGLWNIVFPLQVEFVIKSLQRPVKPHTSKSRLTQWQSSPFTGI